MDSLRKRILHDEDMHPVAVQIDYQDWLELEGRISPTPQPSNEEYLRLLNETRGIRQGDDGLAYQLKIRSEWNAQ